LVQVVVTTCVVPFVKVPVAMIGVVWPFNFREVKAEDSATDCRVGVAGGGVALGAVELFPLHADAKRATTIRRRFTVVLRSVCW
jgi:hypothetical protein